jgi:hypothetical protein
MVFTLYKQKININVKKMDFQLIFFLAILSYVILSIYLIIVALSEDPISRHKVVIGFSSLLFSLYEMGYYFETMYLNHSSIYLE